LRMLAKDGTPLEKASYAFPEVQEFMLSLIREVAENFDVDGINLGWIRGPQFVGYETPVIRDFKEEYDEDPRNLDDNDIRIQRLRARYLTDFTGKVRRLLNEVGSKRARKIELSAWVFSPETNLFYGLDVETWLKEGLLDSIIGSGTKEFIETAKTHHCKFYLGSRGTKEVLEGYENGVDGFVFWDLNVQCLGYWHELPESWAVTSRMGHKEEVKDFAKEPPRMKRITLKTVGGFDICHTTNRGANERNYWPPEMLPLYSGG